MEEINESELKFVAVPKRKPFILFRAWQWVIAAFFVIVVIMLLSNVVKMSAPGAPNVLFVISVVLAVSMVALHSPFLFFRVSWRMRIGAYLAIPVSFIVFGSTIQKVDEAYWKTPAGAKELAEKVKQEEQEAKRAAAVEERRKAQEQVDQQRRERAAEEAGQQMKLLNCRALSEEVIKQYKKGGRVEIIEINDISVRPQPEYGQEITCDGSAITANGDMQLQFGLERSPQGKDILSSKLY